MPQFDTATFPSQIFWLIVTLGFLYAVLSRSILPRIGEVLENRQAHIDHDLERAAAMRDEAQKLTAAWQAELDRARGGAQARIAEIRDKAAAEAAARQAKVDRELAAELATAAATIESARQAALAGVSDMAAGLTADAVVRLGGHRPGKKEVAAAMAEASRV